MIMKRILILLCLAIPQASTLFAQKDATEQNTTIAIQPLQLINCGGIRLDFEKRIGKTPTWIQLSLTGYPTYNKKDVDKEYDYNRYHEYWNPFGEDFSSMWGVSADLNCKYYLNRKQSLYFAGGFSYGYFEIKYIGSAWNDYVEDGLKYHEFTHGVQEQKIKRIGVNTLFGYQIPTRSAFLFDVYTGLGYRYGFYDENKTAFHYGLFSPGRRDLVFLLGIRLGVKW